MKNREYEHEMMRRQCWIQAWCAVASNDSVTDIKVVANWADRALQMFDEKFKQVPEVVVAAPVVNP